MTTLLYVGALLLFLLVFFGSAWYVAFRLRTAFDWSRRWLSRVLAAAVLIGSLMLMGPATHAEARLQVCRICSAVICSPATFF